MSDAVKMRPTTKAKWFRTSAIWEFLTALVLCPVLLAVRVCKSKDKIINANHWMSVHAEKHTIGKSDLEPQTPMCCESAYSEIIISKMVKGNQGCCFCFLMRLHHTPHKNTVLQHKHVEMLLYFCSEQCRDSVIRSWIWHIDELMTEKVQLSWLIMALYNACTLLVKLLSSHYHENIRMSL